MKSKQGDSLNGVGLSQGNTQVTSGTFKDATTFYCHADGDLKFKWADGTSDTYSWVKGDNFPVFATAIEVVSGTFSVGYD